jgi:two-component system, OmpR family, sensor histidine kinase KdpD
VESRFSGPTDAKRDFGEELPRAAAALRSCVTKIIRLSSNAPKPSKSSRGRGYASALGITCLCTAAAYPVYPHFDPVNIVMIYLLGTTLGALRLGRGPSALMAAANVVAFDFFFVPPTFSFYIAETQYFFTLSVMLVVALVIANLMVTIRHHREVADGRERRTAILYAMSQELAVSTDAASMAAVAIKHIAEVFHSAAAVLVAQADGRLVRLQCAAESTAPVAVDMELARRASARGARSSLHATYLPLHGSRSIIGVLVVQPETGGGIQPPDQQRLLDTFAAQLALSLERARLAEAAEAARLSAERAALRNTLLISISHDLRTPLSAIAGAGSLIAQPEYALNLDRRATLGHLIERKARDMSQLLSNVLDLMRLEFGSGALRTDWHAIEELVALALRTKEVPLTQWRVLLMLPADLPMILVEATLIVQILSNLLENAAKYTPPGTTITISAAARQDDVLLTIEDDGPGLPAGDPERLFEKFQRGHAESNVVGVGLGLAISRAAARLHGGDICAMERPGGGARFEIRLPVEKDFEASPAAELPA